MSIRTGKLENENIAAEMDNENKTYPYNFFLKYILLKNVLCYPSDYPMIEFLPYTLSMDWIF